jgi:hypothetical protein
MALSHGISRARLLEDNGLYGRRYVGYYADIYTFFVPSLYHGDTNQTTSINSFTSSADNYSWMWLGYFLAPTTGSYTFFTSSDDASMLWLGRDSAINTWNASTALVNNAGAHGVIETSGTTNLVAGVMYPMRITFGEAGGGDIITVSFSGPGIAKTTNGAGYYYGGTTLWKMLNGAL